MCEHLAAKERSLSSNCARCRLHIASFNVRGERLCRDCFIKYIGSKVLKRVEATKIRGDFHGVEKKILIINNLDVSSICLLQIMQEMLRRRSKRGPRVGYTLHSLYISQPTSGDAASTQGSFDDLNLRFEDFTYHTATLHDVFSIIPTLYQDLQVQLQLPEADNRCDSQRLNSVLGALKSQTSRKDAISILGRRLAYAYAHNGNFDSIIFTDSTTQLAQKILSETVKGRGGSLPWLTTDHTSVDGIPCFYLVQDLLEKELVLYSQQVEPALSPLVDDRLPRLPRKETVSSKDVAIDDLMSEYFASVEEEYPSIVANVVRTSSKLVSTSHQSLWACVFCGLPISQTRNMENGQENQASISVAPPNNTERRNEPFCHACMTTFDLR